MSTLSSHPCESAGENINIFLLIDVLVLTEADLFSEWVESKHYQKSIIALNSFPLLIFIFIFQK